MDDEPPPAGSAGHDDRMEAQRWVAAGWHHDSRVDSIGRLPVRRRRHRCPHPVMERPPEIGLVVIEHRAMLGDPTPHLVR
jgi:hypothetical protein